MLDRFANDRGLAPLLVLLIVVAVIGLAIGGIALIRPGDEASPTAES